MFELKKYHLYIVVVIFFLVTFIGLNLKYDRYYRIPGITNENRILLDTYLTSEEKDYLVQNSISVNSFIKYLSYPHFRLEYYEYYNQITDFSSFDSIDEALFSVNEFMDHYKENPEINMEEIYPTMLEGNLLKDYITHEESFNINDIALYTEARKKAEEGEDYITKLSAVKDTLSRYGYQEEEVSELLLNLIGGYTLDNIVELADYHLKHPSFHYVLNINALDTVVKENDYLGNYEPNDLEMITAPRLYYFSYLRKEANDAYNEMLEAFNASATGDELLIVSGYTSLETLEEENKKVDESQLGLTLHLKAYGFKDEQFEETEAKAWLDRNAHLFGFVLRYPESESYTYRYVGVELATKLRNSGMTLEEYQEQKDKEDGLS